MSGYNRAYLQKNQVSWEIGGSPLSISGPSSHSLSDPVCRKFPLVLYSVAPGVDLLDLFLQLETVHVFTKMDLFVAMGSFHFPKHKLEQFLIFTIHLV